MSAAVAEAIIVEQQKPIVALEKPVVIPAPKIESEPAITDHPLVPVVIAMVLAAVGAVAFVGSIVFWLAVRHSGVVAP